MLETLRRILNQPEVGPEWSLIEGCALVADVGGILIVRPLTPQLHSDAFQKLVDRLRQGDLNTFRLVRFDFWRVKKLVGPWGVHFAMLIKLARDVTVRVGVTGLSGQPAGLAWVFRGSLEIRSLLSARPSTRNARMDTGLRKVA